MKFRQSVLLALFCYAQTIEAALAAISFSNRKPKQGETVTVEVSEATVATGQDNPLKMEFLGRQLALFPEEAQPSVWRTLLAIPADLKPGQYQIKTPSESGTLEVLDAHFPVQHLHLPEGKDNFLMSAGEQSAIDTAKKTVSPEKLWQGKFSLPSTARRSAAFGLKRVVNGRLLGDYYHSGIDFAASLGSPVKACAAGKVILARSGFRLHGNVIAIDHGQGVISLYIHLQKLLVKEGDNVVSGEKIATVGQSGRANGPHLHFGIYVNQTAADPSLWFVRVF
jgi:lysostaphin